MQASCSPATRAMRVAEFRIPKLPQGFMSRPKGGKGAQGLCCRRFVERALTAKRPRQTHPPAFDGTSEANLVALARLRATSPAPHWTLPSCWSVAWRNLKCPSPSHRKQRAQWLRASQSLAEGMLVRSANSERRIRLRSGGCLATLPAAGFRATLSGPYVRDEQATCQGNTVALPGRMKDVEKCD